jgi:hypothetical protein
MGATVVYIKVSRRSGVWLGTLQVLQIVAPKGKTSNLWEWIGANDSQDSGTFEWRKNDTTGRVRAELTSGIYKRVVADLFAEKWNNGPTPPFVPWFADPDLYEWDNMLQYYGKDGTINLDAIWFLK